MDKDEEVDASDSQGRDGREELHEKLECSCIGSSMRSWNAGASLGIASEEGVGQGLEADEDAEEITNSEMPEWFL